MFAAGLLGGVYFSQFIDNIWKKVLCVVVVCVSFLSLSLYMSPGKDEIVFIYNPSDKVYVQGPDYRRANYALGSGWWRYSIGIRANRRIEHLTATLFGIEQYSAGGQWSHDGFPSAPCEIGWNGVSEQFEPLDLAEGQTGILIFAGFSADESAADNGFNLGCKKGNPEINAATYNMKYGNYRMMLNINFKNEKKEYTRNIRLGWSGNPASPLIEISDNLESKP